MGDELGVDEVDDLEYRIPEAYLDIPCYPLPDALMESGYDAYREDERADEGQHEQVYLREDEYDVPYPLGECRNQLCKEAVPEARRDAEERLEGVEAPVLDGVEDCPDLGPVHPKEARLPVCIVLRAVLQLLLGEHLVLWGPFVQLPTEVVDDIPAVGLGRVSGNALADNAYRAVHHARDEVEVLNQEEYDHRLDDVPRTPSPTSGEDLRAQLHQVHRTQQGPEGAGEVVELA